MSLSVKTVLTHIHVEAAWEKLCCQVLLMPSTKWRKRHWFRLFSDLLDTPFIIKNDVG